MMAVPFNQNMYCITIIKCCEWTFQNFIVYVLASLIRRLNDTRDNLETSGSYTLHFGLKYEIIYQLNAIEYLFVFFQLDMFRAYTPIFRSNGCYNFFTYAAYGVLGVVRCRS